MISLDRLSILRIVRFQSLENPTFKSPVRFRHLISAKRKHCHEKLSVFERATFRFCKFWQQEVNIVPLKGLGVKIQP